MASRQRQFEEAMIRMEGHLEQAASPAKQWQKFADSLKRIEKFLLSVNTYVSDLVLGDIKTAIWMLGSNMQVYQYKDTSGELHYRAYRKETNDDKDVVRRARRQVKSVYDSDPRWKKFDW